MSKQVTISDEQYEMLQNGGTLLVRPPKQKRWEPQDGTYFANAVIGRAYFNSAGSNDARRAGMYFPSEELATKAASSAHKRQRLVNWVLEHAPEHDIDGPGFYVGIDEAHQPIIGFTEGMLLGLVTMPEPVALSLAAALDSGEAVL